jgi:hypothetical protein
MSGLGTFEIEKMSMQNPESRLINRMISKGLEAICSAGNHKTQHKLF